MQTDFSKYLVQEPLREVGNRQRTKPLTGRQTPTMTFMCKKLVPESNAYIEFGWIYEVPDPNPHLLEHAHAYDEIVLHIGMNPQDPSDLGAEIEFFVGDEPLIINKTSALFVPRGLRHGPITWRSVSRPHIQMAMVLGAGDISQAAPGGFNGARVLGIEEALRIANAK